MVRLQVSNVLARNCSTTGVQSAPKSFNGSFMRNAETSYLRPELVEGQVNRKAHCWGCGIEMLEEANAIL